MVSLAKKILCLCFVLGTAAIVAAEDNTDMHDNSRIALFLQPGVSFLSFDQREYFQDAIDTIHHEFLLQALDKRDSANVAKQNFQKVNFCFPVYAGLQFQLRQDHFVSVGAGYIYNNESVVLVDQNNRSHNYSYTIQGFPLFLEYRFAIPVNLMTLSDGSLFSIALRWYWALPHTEIYTSWGKLAAETPYYGSGFGISVGYLLFNWRNLYVFGDLGYSSISVKSKKRYSDIVPDGPEEKAKWNIGGIQLQIRVSLGVWNEEPVIEEDSTTVVNDSTAAPIAPAGSDKPASEKSSESDKKPASKETPASEGAKPEAPATTTPETAAAPKPEATSAPKPEAPAATKPETPAATKPE